MSLLNTLQPIAIMFSAVLGLFLGVFTPLSGISPRFIELFLMLLLFMLFISIDFTSLQKSFFNVRYTLTSLILNFIITPILAFALGTLFFPNSIDIHIGLLMLLVTPCTDWYLVFTGISKGNVELNVSILPLNLILQIALMPVYIILFINNRVSINADNIILNILFLLLFPFIGSIIYKFFAQFVPPMQKYIAEQSDNLQLLFLCLAVIVMFATEGEKLLDNPVLVLKMFVPLLCFFVITFFIAQTVGRLLRFPKQDIIALNFTTLARNSPLALAIAVAAFPDKPLISLVLVVGSLIELPTLSVVAAILSRWKD